MNTIHILQEVFMISDEEILRKAKTEWEMPVEEVLRYEQIAKPEHYGKFGNLALAYLQNHRIDKLVEINDLPEYLHEIDRQADELYETLYRQMSEWDEYKRTGDYLTDVQRIKTMQSIIEETILDQIVYV